MCNYCTKYSPLLIYRKWCFKKHLYSFTTTLQGLRYPQLFNPNNAISIINLNSTYLPNTPGKCMIPLISDLSNANQQGLSPTDTASLHRGNKTSYCPIRHAASLPEWKRNSLDLLPHHTYCHLLLSRFEMLS